MVVVVVGGDEAAAAAIGGRASGRARRRHDGWMELAARAGVEWSGVVQCEEESPS